MITTFTQAASAQFQETYPQLEEYLRIAVDQNPELRSLRYLYEAEREKARETGILPDPELNIRYDFNPMMPESQLGRFSLSAMQMFPWIGTLDARKQAQIHTAEVQRSLIDSRQLEILRDIRITWLDIAEVTQHMRIADQTLQLVGDLEQLVEIRYETARTSQADILRIQMEKQRIQNRIRNLEDRLAPLLASFNELLNRERDEEVNTSEPQQLPGPAYPAEEIAGLARDQNPVFETLRLRESALEQQERAAVLSGRPSVGLGLEVMGRDFGPMSMNPNATESFIGMATIRLPIYRAKTSSQKQQISSMLQSVEMQRQQTENRISSELEQALETLRSSNRSIELLNVELIPRARQVLDILSEEYTAGNTAFDELLQIQRELLDLEFERVEAIVNQNKAMARIERLIGGSSLLRGDR
ncbi:TolC family protein [Rhodohalobacter mucosus]|nr:TolC family protein [Rhodohalobacter mucosus]